MSEEKSEEEGLPRLSVRDLLKVVPPPHLLRESRSKKISEKRVRVLYSESVEEGHMMISPRLAELLDIRDSLEISVKGRRYRFKAVMNENLDLETIQGNGGELSRYGIANNSIVVVRRA